MTQTIYLTGEALLGRLRQAEADGANGKGDAYLRLLNDLGPWGYLWLDDGVLQLAENTLAVYTNEEAVRNRRQKCRDLPIEPGSCWPLFVFDLDSAILRKSFVFPLQWSKNKPHDRRLPEDLTEFAETIVQQFRRAGNVIDENAGYGLQPHDPAWLNSLDLSKLRLRCSSAWASLAGGLFLLERRGKPNRLVWTSAQWNSEAGTIQPVDDIEAKFNEAWELGGRRFYVSTGQVDEVRKWVAGKCKGEPERQKQCHVEELNSSESRGVYDSLLPYLRELRLEPGDEAPPEEQAQFYVHIGVREGASEWYRKHLFADVARRLKEQIESQGEDLTAIRLLVTVLSMNHELLDLAIEIFAPSAIMLLHTSDKVMTASGRNHKERIERTGQRTVTLVPTPKTVEEGMIADGTRSPPIESLRGFMAERIREFIASRQATPAQLVADLTPGFFHYRLPLFLAIPPGAAAFTCTNALHDPLTHGNIPFTETPLFWRPA